MGWFVHKIKVRRLTPDEMVLKQAREMEDQVKERREWAQKKALQAAERLSKDMADLRTLRMEKERRERMKKAGTPAVSLDEGTVKRLVEMEEGLKKASLQARTFNFAFPP